MLLNIRIEANVCPTYQTHIIYFNSILPFNQKRGLFLECLISETLSHFSSIRSNSAISLHEFASQKQITERYKGVFVRNLQSRKKTAWAAICGCFLADYIPHSQQCVCFVVVVGCCIAFGQMSERIYSLGFTRKPVPEYQQQHNLSATYLILS